jgi:hypothetical protein
MGFAESKALVRVVAANGALQDVVVEPPEVFSKDRLDEWSKTFPYEYGFEKKAGLEYFSSQHALSRLERHEFQARCLCCGHVVAADSNEPPHGLR